MEHSQNRIDLNTGRPLPTTPNLMPVRHELVRRRSEAVEMGMSNFNGTNMGFYSVSSKLDEIHRVRVLDSEQSVDRTKMTGTGDDKRLTSCPRCSCVEMARSVESPPQFQLPNMEAEELHRKSLDQNRAKSKTVSSRLPVPLFRPPKARSRANSEQVCRRPFTDETVKQRQTEQVRKKAVADDQLKRRSAPPTRSNSKPYRPRSATFVIEKAGVRKKLNDGGDQEQSKKCTTSKTASSNVRPLTMVVMNKAALLRLERFKK